MVRPEPPGHQKGDRPAKNRAANHLISEKSPYLIQHADNPVDWYPWGEAAFERAFREDKPVFLSIGYATCHWCHVMAHESFEDESVARLLNDSFVCIKVDREERPDIDGVYMSVCQMMTGTGGWPLTIVMTPNKKPFFAGTYLPREGRSGMKGLLDLLPEISALWKEHKSDLVRSADEVSRALNSPSPHGSAPGSAPAPGEQVLMAAYEDLRTRFDPGYGGFSRAPKFPSPHVLMFLLRSWNRTGDPDALAMVQKTLDAIRGGGIYDQIGFGVHRYSVDERWHVPHFEKMLYDQALLAMAYTETYLATNQPGYRRTAEEILTYILRDMTDPQGAFYSAEDADSEGREGAFYLWTERDLERVLGSRDAALVREIFCVGGTGNFSRPKNGSAGIVLQRSGAMDEIAKKHGMSGDELDKKAEAIRRTLFSAREERTRPLRDDKILADGNGFAIAALAKAAKAFDEKKYADAGERAARFILGAMRNPDGGLFHRYRDGEAAIPAFADDYTGMVFGLFELYEATFEEAYLASAIELNRYFLDHFQDPGHGGFFTTADTSEHVLVRRKEACDGAVPSCNSVALLNLLHLGRMTGEDALEKTAAAMVRSFSAAVNRAPSAYAFFLCGLDYAIGPSAEVVISGDLHGADTQALIRACGAYFLPSLTVAFLPAHGAVPPPFLPAEPGRYAVIDGKATAYICSRFACRPAVTGPDDLLGALLVLRSPRRNIP
jgi:uncharacterized protein YyaL (SSP411 family)